MNKIPCLLIMLSLLFMNGILTPVFAGKTPGVSDKDGDNNNNIKKKRKSKSAGHRGKTSGKKSKDSQSYASAGCDAIWREDYGEALRCYKKSFKLNADPSSLDYSHAGLAAFNLGKYAEALDYCGRAFEKSPPKLSDWVSLVCAGKSAFHLKKYTEALSYFRKALQGNMRAFWFHYADAGETALKLGHYKEALAYYEIAFLKNPNAHSSYYKDARLAALLKEDFVRADKYFNLMDDDDKFIQFN